MPPEQRGHQITNLESKIIRQIEVCATVLPEVHCIMILTWCLECIEESKPSLLISKLITFQYYFGDFNLMRDKYLQNHIQRDPEGCILWCGIRCERKTAILMKTEENKQTQHLSVQECGTHITQFKPFQR